MKKRIAFMGFGKRVASFVNTFREIGRAQDIEFCGAYDVCLIQLANGAHGTYVQTLYTPYSYPRRDTLRSNAVPAVRSWSTVCASSRSGPSKLIMYRERER